MSDNRNHILPQLLTSRTGYSLAWMCLLLMLAVWTLKGLPAERIPTISQKSNIRLMN